MNITIPLRDPLALDRALRPRSVAIMGASDDPRRISGRTLHYLRVAGYQGRFYPVNNRRATVQGLKSYASLGDLPETPDLALITLPAGAVADAVGECAAKGVGAAVIYAAGFAETGPAGKAAQDELLARAGKVRLFGPNCMGVINSHIGLIGTFGTAFSEGMPSPSPLAIVAQSGAYAGHLAHLARERNMGVGYWASTGNEADVDVADLIEWLALQDDVSVIMVYLEGARNGSALARALSVAHERRKAIICMKVGGSAAGAEAAKSHTASLAGSDAVYDGLFEQYGVHRATTTEEQIDIAYAAMRGIYPAGRKLGIVTVSGGFGIQICDSAERRGLEVAPLPAQARARLEIINPLGSAANPCDMTASVNDDVTQITRTLGVLYEDGGYDALIGSFSVLPGSPTFGPAMRQAIAEGTKNHKDRLTLLCMAAAPAIIKAYDEAGLLVFPDSDRAAAVVAALAKLREGFERRVVKPPVDTALVRELGVAPLSEAKAQAILGSIGVPFLPSRLVTGKDDAADAARALGAPLAMKIISPDILHKTEIGGVILNVDGPPAASAAYETLRARAAAHRPDARIEGVLVSPMAPKGVETILGVNNDPVFGPVVMFGLGGVMTELFQDIVFRIAPFDQDEALRMIRAIRGHRLFEGYRGAPPVDIDALCALLARLSAFAAANAGTIETIDLNPVLAHTDGVTALDAMLIARPSDAH